MEQLTKEQAIAFGENKCYEEMSYRDRALFQMEQRLLCMPFSVFHEAMEKTLGRPVYTHEFGLDWEGLHKELLGERESPTLKEIIELIPADKRIVIGY